MMKLERLDHFGIEVSDLARAERFYTEVLGLSVVAHLGDQVLLDCAGQNLALFGVERPPMPPAERQARISHPLGKGHHAFRVSRVERLRKSRMSERSTTTSTAPAPGAGESKC